MSFCFLVVLFGFALVFLVLPTVCLALPCDFWFCLVFFWFLVVLGLVFAEGLSSFLVFCCLGFGFC